MLAMEFPPAGGVSNVPTMATRNYDMFLSACQADTYESWRRGWDSRHLVEFARQILCSATLLPSHTRNYDTWRLVVKAARAQNSPSSRPCDVRKCAQKVLSHRSRRAQNTRYLKAWLRFLPPPLLDELQNETIPDISHPKPDLDGAENERPPGNLRQKALGREEVMQ